MVGQEPRKSTSDQNIDLINPPRRFLSSRWPQSVSKIASRSLPIDKNRYETTLGASIYRFLSIRSALSKTDFQPLSPPIFIIHVKSWFRIGIYGTNSPSIVFVSMSRVFCHLLIFKVKKWTSYAFLSIGVALGSSTLLRCIANTESKSSCQAESTDICRSGGPSARHIFTLHLDFPLFFISCGFLVCVYLCLYLSIPVYICLCLPIVVHSYLQLFIVGYSCLCRYISVHGCL